MAVTNVIADRCDGCGICVDICPDDVFRMKDGKAIIAYPDDCDTCFLCETDCPRGAIVVSAEVLGVPLPY